MSGQVTTTIGQLVASGALEFGDGYRTKRSEHGSGGYRIIRVADVAENNISFDGPDFVSTKFSRAIGPKAGQSGDILLTTKGTVGRVAVMPQITETVVYSPQLCYFRIRNPRMINSRYLRFWFSSPEFWRQATDRMNNTDMAAYINMADVRSLKISLPSMDTQQAIAEVLGALDDKIAANTKLAATAEKYISAKHSEAINKPNTEFLPLSDAFDIDFGEPFKGAHFSEPGEGRPLIRIRDLKTFSSQTWTEEQRPREVLVQPGDVVVGMDAEFRPTTWLGEPGLLNQRVCRVRGKSSGPAFVRESLKDPLLAIENYKTATTVIHLNKKDLDETKLLVPAPQVLAEFEGAVEGLYTYRVSLAAESRLLATTRDALLPQVMSGKLRVMEAEALVSTAV